MSMKSLTVWQPIYKLMFNVLPDTIFMEHLLAGEVDGEGVEARAQCGPASHMQWRLMPSAADP